MKCAKTGEVPVGQRAPASELSKSAGSTGDGPRKPPRVLGEDNAAGVWGGSPRRGETLVNERRIPGFRSRPARKIPDRAQRFWEQFRLATVGMRPAIQGIQAMVHVLGVTAPLHERDFVLGAVSGIVLTLAGVIWSAQLGLLPKESEALILSADYRLSRNEMQLREQIRYLEHELDLLRRARSTTAGYTGRTGS